MQPTIMEAINQKYSQQQARNGHSLLTPLEQTAFESFTRQGIPTVRHEEWKYTRINSALNRPFALTPVTTFTASDLESWHLPGHSKANTLVFINGTYAPHLSNLRSAGLTVQSLEAASTGEARAFVTEHLGHSSRYITDGIHAMNTAFVQEGVLIQVAKGKALEHPVYIYQVTDARTMPVLSQPRLLISVAPAANVKFVETSVTTGSESGFTNSVVEVVVDADAVVDYYKLQADAPTASQVSTTHFRQIRKSAVHAVTVSLSGQIVRNNLNMVMEADHCDSGLFGLYYLKGQTHVDNHTVVDNCKPHCLSNELYKGILDESSTAVFNGKIFVQRDAQKINAFQSNKNVLLSDSATVNTKPQLEIFADDVKCSHGCTVGQLDEEAFFYLRSRGISEKTAKAMLVHAYALDVLEHINLPIIRDYVDQLIADRLEYDHL